MSELLVLSTDLTPVEGKLPAGALVRAKTEHVAVVDDTTTVRLHVAGTRGAMTVEETSTTPPALNLLPLGDQLFALAWIERRKPKARRPTDGLSWDAPGYKPPK